MWVKKFKMFLEQDEVDPAVVDPNVPAQAEQTNQEALKYIRNEIQDYYANKKKMEELFRAKNEDTDGKIDLEKELRNKIYQNKKFPTERNRFLSRYEQMLNSERSIVEMQKAIEQDLTNIADRESKLRDIQSRKSSISSTSEPTATDNKQISEELDKQEKILTDELGKLRDNVQKSKGSLNKMKQTGLEKAREDFKKFIASEETRLKSFK